MYNKCVCVYKIIKYETLKGKEIRQRAVINYTKIILHLIQCMYNSLMSE